VGTSGGRSLPPFTWPRAARPSGPIERMDRGAARLAKWQHARYPYGPSPEAFSGAGNLALHGRLLTPKHMPETPAHFPPHAEASSSPDSIGLYGPRAVGLGILASLLGVAGGSGAAALVGAGDAVSGGAVGAGVLTGSWLLVWVAAALTGPSRVATAAMAWVALSTVRLFVLVLAGIALAFAAPEMGLGLWLALLLGGLVSIAVDTALAKRAFGRPVPTPGPTGGSTAGSTPESSASLSPTTGGSR